MQVIINSNNQVDLNKDRIQDLETTVADAMERFSSWITRVEVHLTDENSASKGGSDDIRCLMEARPAHQQPVSIEVRASTVDHAIAEGTKTLERRLGTMADKARTQGRKGR